MNVGDADELLDIGERFERTRPVVVQQSIVKMSVSELNRFGQMQQWTMTVRTRAIQEAVIAHTFDDRRRH